MAEIMAVELFVVSIWEARDGNKAVKVRAVQWIIDGKSTGVKIERREFYRGEDGEMKTGKAQGFGLKDLEALKPHWPKIIDLMKNPPPVPMAPQAAPAEEEREAPF